MELQVITDAFNSNLDGGLGWLEAQLQSINPSVGTVAYQSDDLFDEVLDHPNRYGFTNSTQSSLKNSASCSVDQDSWFFSDDFHPTTAVHWLIASRFASAMAEPVPSPLPLAAAGTAFAFSRRLRRRIQKREP
jgi:phospholipase/lecithinase/hemolysin